jgi:hypothetical protein
MLALRHHCHGCRVVATIATAATATATAMAAAVSAAISTVFAGIATAFWLIVVCPCAASAFGHCCLPSSLPLLATNTIATVVAAANCCLLLLRRNHVMFKMTFKVIFEHFCCHFLVDYCLPLRCLCFCHFCLPMPLHIRQPPHPRLDVRRQHHDLPVLDNDGQVKVDIKKITFTKVIF